MDYIEQSDNATRQAIDSATVFGEYCRVRIAAQAYQGGMYWKQQDGYSYLVKTAPDNRQQRMGPRSAETEAIYTAFVARKTEVEGRLKSLRDALKEAERLNKALKVGRVPAIVVDLLQALDDAGLAAHFTVVGTHALYAYEAAAGVRIAPGAMATQDVDLLWDARRRVRFVAEMDRLNISMLAVLQKADPSFVRKEGQNETAINGKGFEVDFLRRQPKDGDPHPMCFSHFEEDLWPVQARRAHVLTDAPRFEHMVVATTGRMAWMRTVDPRVFVDFKTWMAQAAPGRPDAKRRRDARQAGIVQTLLDEGLLIPGADAE
ncbi:MAG: hypothetical protein H7172_10075 [Ferruginibacter sp.]|nr:hypothetical protein [Rhodoferax sp.]